MSPQHGVLATNIGLNMVEIMTSPHRLCSCSAAKMVHNVLWRQWASNLELLSRLGSPLNTMYQVVPLRFRCRHQSVLLSFRVRRHGWAAQRHHKPRRTGRPASLSRSLFAKKDDDGRKRRDVRAENKQISRAPMWILLGQMLLIRETRRSDTDRSDMRPCSHQTEIYGS